MARTPNGYWQRLLASGELHRLAQGCESEIELARRAGAPVKSLWKLRDRMRSRGERFPTLFELQGGSVPGLSPPGGFLPTPTIDNQFLDEDPTDEHVLTADDAHEAAPDGFHVRGVSTLYGSDGAVKQQWVKTNRDAEDRLNAMMEALSGLGLAGVSEPVLPPEHADEDLLAVYPLGDPHLGMYAWSEETGNSFDLHVAERNLCGAMDQLVSLAPPAEHALLIDLGDFFHADNTQNRTMRSGNALDVDTRWAKVLSVGVRAKRRLIDRSLEKHGHTTVWCLGGNHDDHSAVFLALALAQFYEREPRVHIVTSPKKFQYYKFGKCLVGGTHGDTVKTPDLLGVMAVDCKDDWSETDHRYFYCGHVHHDRVKELPGVTVEYMRTLAARDAWHHAQGYRSERDAKLDILHRRWGRIQRHIVGINQITCEDPS